MTQLIINIEDTSIVPLLKKMLGAIDGVTIAKSTTESSKSGIEEAYEDVAAGRVTHYDNAEALFKSFGI
ncbi:MAG: response regulator [Candidatus Amulumruptor caecigallinarius]|nr:response regulator [Candidatus Amulumruptor caecigallinarius]MCM1396443.1 response regulator [Candidatus Amulumruptor caecigallinarius]MCM1453500.1 response regulator [bacterium]